MRIKHLFMLFAITLFAFACGERGVQSGTPQSPDPEIVVVSESPLWLDSEESILEIEYHITNPS